MDLAAFFATRSDDSTHSKPNYFELVATDQLRQSLYDAIRFGVSIYAERYPRYLLRIYNQFDEVYALFMLVVEAHYLHTWHATLLEWFYGIKRVSVKSSWKRFHLVRALMVMVVLPYWYRKLERRHEQMTGGPRARTGFGGQAAALEDHPSPNSEPHTPTQNWLRQEERLLERFASRPQLQKAVKMALDLQRFIILKGFPSMHLVLSFVDVGHQLAYAFDYSPYWSLGMRLLGQTYGHIDAEDQRKYEQARDAFRLRRPKYQQRRPKYQQLLLRGVDLLKMTVPTGLLFLRFLEWWYASGYSRALKDEDVLEHDAIPAPPSLPPVPEMKDVVSQPALCPICKRPRTNPCMLAISGYVFCYPCIYAYVERNFRCPVTLAMVDVKQPGFLRKIYDVQM